MIIKGGWSDNGTIYQLTEFLEMNNFISEAYNHNFYDLDKKKRCYDKSCELVKSYVKKHGVSKYDATKESIQKQNRFIKLCVVSADRLLTKREKEEMVELLTEKWYRYRKNNFSEEKEDANNPHFEIVDSVKEEDQNKEVCYCFCKCGGVIVVM